MEFLSNDVALYVVIALAILFVLGYAIGAKYNYRLQRKIWKVMSEELKKYSKSASLKKLGSGGFAILCSKLGSLDKTEIDVVLSSREIILYYLVTRLRGIKDRLFIYADFPKQPPFKMEMVKKGSKYAKTPLQSLENLKAILFEGIPNQLVVKATNKEIGMELLSDKQLLKKLSTTEDFLERVSIAKEHPQLLILSELNQETIISLIDLAITIGNSMAKITRGRK
ncbi:MAG: hypothetical protein ACFFCD_15675 [Promethearchaeota archaeon]